MERSEDFVALGHAGSEHYAGLETFANPGVSHVTLTSDELTAVCPVTGQPDLYLATIEYWPESHCIESRSLKLYLAGYRNEGHFCEALAVKIRDDVAGRAGAPVRHGAGNARAEGARRDHDHGDLLGRTRRTKDAHSRSRGARPAKSRVSDYP